MKKILRQIGKRLSQIAKSELMNGDLTVKIKQSLT